MPSTNDRSCQPARDTAWMKCCHWAICRHCEVRIETGQWQALVDVPDRGRWWIHQACALELGATARDPDDPADSPSPPPAPSSPVRIVVIGSAAWPRDRAVEIRDGIEAVARGHREVVIVHGTRRDHRGRSCGVDAWAELTAQRLGYTPEPHASPAVTVDELHALRPTVVVAFPLDTPAPDSSGVDVGIEALAGAAELAGMPVLVHRTCTTVATLAG